MTILSAKTIFSSRSSIKRNVFSFHSLLKFNYRSSQTFHISTRSIFFFEFTVLHLWYHLFSIELNTGIFAKLAWHCRRCTRDNCHSNFLGLREKRECPYADIWLFLLLYDTPKTFTYINKATSTTWRNLFGVSGSRLLSPFPLKKIRFFSYVLFSAKIIQKPAFSSTFFGTFIV